MKKYLVIKEYRNIHSCSIIGQFDKREDAETYARLTEGFAWVYEQSK